jgi:hypothetical protein
MRDALRRRAEDAPGRLGTEVRIGINTGEVVLRLIRTSGHTEYTPVGHAANLAARMQSAAPAGGIVISDDTRRLVEGYFELHGLGPTELKGIEQRLKLYEVTGADALHGHFDLSVRRGLTKFVGRESELGQMAHALELVRSGHGQMVAVVAEAGTGKSRLFYEFKATLPTECKLLEAYSVSHGKASAWLPVLELLHEYFGFQQVDDAATRREKVRSALRALDPALSDTHPYLFTLLAITESPDPIAQMDPGLKRQRTLDALKRIVLRESVKQPVVIIFEDLHWIDSRTQALLDLLADSLPNARVLLLVNYRPEYRHEWGNKSYYSQLRLDALDGRSAREMLGSLLGDGAELDQLKRMVTERTEGNPFFIEEILQALFDAGALVRNGRVKITHPVSQVRLPPTVQGILASRIDRQPGDHKQLLQTLAVLGKESTIGLIRQISPMTETQLERTLAALRAAEFIYEQPATAGVEYTFKHALTQEVAYSSLLSERRRHLHEQAAEAIEILSAANLPDQYDHLAHHYGRSGNAVKAVKYLHLAAQQSASRGAYAEAIDQLNYALELLKTQPAGLERDRSEATLRIDLAVCLKFGGSFGTAENLANLEHADELCQRVGNDINRFEVLEALADQYSGQADAHKILPLGEAMLGIAMRTENIEFIGRARCWLETSFLYDGDPTAALEQAELAWALPSGALSVQDSMGWNWRSRTRTLGAYVLWCLGFPKRARATSAEAVAIARDITASASGLVLALAWSSVSDWMLRDWGEARDHCTRQSG